jgi:uncharacterized protein (DUF302 family)
MKRQYLLALLLLALATTATADELLMARMARPFPEAINSLQESIRTHGYTVSRVQRVDVGLTSSGFQTAEYRIVFFGRAGEVRALASSHPELIPYLPLNIVVFAEGDDTLLLATNPHKLGEFFDKPELKTHFSRWERDLQAIFEELRRLP